MVERNADVRQLLIVQIRGRQQYRRLAPQALDEFAPGNVVDFILMLLEPFHRGLGVDAVERGIDQFGKRIRGDQEFDLTQIGRADKADAFAFRNPYAEPPSKRTLGCAIAVSLRSRKAL